MLPFLGTAALCGWLAVVAFRTWGSASATWLAVGSHAADAAKQWHGYYGSWLPLNHLRALGGIGAAAAFTAAALA